MISPRDKLHWSLPYQSRRCFWWSNIFCFWWIMISQACKVFLFVCTYHHYNWMGSVYGQWFYALNLNPVFAHDRLIVNRDRLRRPYTLLFLLTCQHTYRLKSLSCHHHDDHYHHDVERSVSQSVKLGPFIYRTCFAVDDGGACRGFGEDYRYHDSDIIILFYRKLKMMFRNTQSKAARSCFLMEWAESVVRSWWSKLLLPTISADNTKATKALNWKTILNSFIPLAQDDTTLQISFYHCISLNQSQNHPELVRHDCINHDEWMNERYYLLIERWSKYQTRDVVVGVYMHAATDLITTSSPRQV